MRFLSFLLTVAVFVSAPAPVVRGANAAPDFNREVRPILSDKCMHCHGPDEAARKGKLRLDTADGVAKIIKPGKALESEFYKRLLTTDPDLQMPPPESPITKQLTPREIATLREWLQAGAPYSTHWAFEAPRQAPPPASADPAWNKNPVDRFIHARLLKEGLQPAPEADRATLIRRVTLDLTGTLPTLAEVDAFLRDTRADAYERLVDRLLTSPHYGERMALAWMDLARYGDSSVYHADGPRDMWGWRDWVIRAYNRNLPFDQFTLDQIAGDLVPDATLDQKIASGFNRNHATTDEGGVFPEEARVDYVVDRVKTTSSTWLGLSLECAQCHDHKYDPITQKEYYQFYAYFNNTKDTGMQTRQGNAEPKLEIPDPEADNKRQAARVASDEALAKFTELRAQTAAGQPFRDWLAQQSPVLLSEDIELTTPAVPAHFFPLGMDARRTATSSLDGLTGLFAEGRFERSARRSTSGVNLNGATVAVFPRGPELERTQAFSFAGWLKVTTNSPTAPVFARLNHAQHFQGWDFGLDNRRPGIHLIHRWPESGLKVCAKEELKPKDWHHVVVTYDGSSKAAGVKIYVNGQLQENVVERDTLDGSIANATPFRIGSRSDAIKFKGEIDELAIYRRALTPGEVRAAAHPLPGTLLVPEKELSPAQRDFLAAHYLHQGDNTNAPALLAEHVKLLAAERKLENLTSSTMVMEDLPEAQMRTTFVLKRGQYDQPLQDAVIKPGIPAALRPLPKDAPANRLGLARWLVQPDHSLTSRVAVNRLWQICFGEGLVRTTEDFGTQGDLPTHQAMLDWLAVDFVKTGWDVKRALKQIVTSATYRQSSRVTPQLRERDPENFLLAHSPRFRLQGEFIRDNALFVAGLLADKIGGPGVRPYQPLGLWEEVAKDAGLSKFVQDRGEKLYRRSMYIYWKRSAPHPGMVIFDAPTREKCTGRRPRTNTPLQALVTLNDPQFVEASRAFAQRILKEGGTHPAVRIAFAIQTALSRPATARETDLLTQLATSQLTRFTADPTKAEALLKIGDSPRDSTLPAPEHAAWTVVASTVLNLDEFLVRN